MSDMRVTLTLQGVVDMLAEIVETPMGYRVISVRESGERHEDGQPSYIIAVAQDDEGEGHAITSYVPWTRLVRHWYEHPVAS